MKIKQFFIDNKDKILNLLKVLLSIVVLFLYSYTLFACGFCTREIIETSDKITLKSKKERIDSTNVPYINLITDNELNNLSSYYYNSSNTIVHDTNYRTTPRISVFPSSSYVLGNTAGVTIYVSYFNANVVRLSTIVFTGGVITTPSNAHYVRIGTLASSINSSWFYQGSYDYGYYVEPLDRILNSEYNEGFDDSLSLLNGNFLSASNLEDLYFYFSDTTEYSYTDLVNSDFDLNRFLKGNYLDFEYLRNYFNGGDFVGLVIDSVDISFKQIVLPIKDFTFSINPFSPTTSFEIWLDSDSLSPSNHVNISSNGDYYNYDINENFYSLEIFDDMFYNTNFKRFYIESSSYSQGFSNGLTVGKDIGYSNGYDVGFDEGYSSGYREGHSSGYREGQLNSGDTSTFFSVFELIGMGFTAWNPILNMEVIPGFTLGVFIAIPIIVGVVFVIFKLLQR